ncbi:acyl-CoA synthetase [Rhodococcus sp. D2-41]|uniref:acyl-CoA synthetase n=1 Tax=Speluncibacter jeojiensis TaxID=2710754 RepID=UPI00240EF2C4|nr:acyl-CoA synthetase [Rhodococcus sp. D2-41]MDG3011107.1 acyl-CoA synthetase [Rhodococcus sp. D2-41]
MFPGKFVTSTPDKPAVIEAATGRSVSFAELETRSIRFAHWLRAQGLRRGDHIAVLSSNDATVFELYWGAVRSGLYLTMVNTHLTADEVAYIVGDCDAQVIVASADLAELAAGIVDDTPEVRVRLAFGGAIPGHLDYAAEVAPMPTQAPSDQPRGTDMLYSSGTTGRPKGIEPELPDMQVDDEGPNPMVALLRAFGFDEHSVYLSPAPLYHAAPLRYSATTQALGGTVILMDHFDPQRCLAAIEQYGVTHSQWVPTHFVRLLKLPAAVRSRYDLSSMRVAVHAAAPCPVEVKREMMSWWGEILYEYYSSTEGVGVTIIGPQDWLSKPGSVGRPIIGVPHVCGEDGAELPIGEIGLIYFAHTDVRFEYHNAPEKTTESTHPEHPDWTTTGDIGRVDEDGFVFLTDRAKFVIISGGVNIYPQEVEGALALHPKVFDVAVIGVPDEEMGERVTAFVQPAPGVTVGGAGAGAAAELAAELIGYCRERIAHYKCPREVVFVDELPRTPTGKLVKGALHAAVSAGGGP